eukprot:403375714
MDIQIKKAKPEIEPLSSIMGTINQNRMPFNGFQRDQKYKTAQYNTQVHPIEFRINTIKSQDQQLEKIELFYKQSPILGQNILQNPTQNNSQTLNINVPFNSRRPSILDEDTYQKIEQIKQAFKQKEEENEFSDSGYEVSSPEEDGEEGVIQTLYRANMFTSKQTQEKYSQNSNKFKTQGSRMNYVKNSQQNKCISNRNFSFLNKIAIFCCCQKNRVEAKPKIRLQRTISNITESNYLNGQKSAQQNWKKLKRRLIQNIRMKKMVDFLSVNKEDEKQDSDEEPSTRCERLMIHPHNKRLKYWNYFLVFDNEIDQRDFTILDFTIVFFGVDFILNFFKMSYHDVSLVKAPKDIQLNYLKNKGLNWLDFGYGEIVGVDIWEYAFQIILQIIGIGFFAYVMGNLHNVLASFSSMDPQNTKVFLKFFVEFQDEGLDQTVKKKSKYNVYYEDRPIIFEKGEMPQHVYFILKGTVYFTNESGIFQYFQFGKGSYFGDSNILNDYFSSYSAFYNEDEGPLQVLRIKASKFLQICQEFPSSKALLERRATERRVKFRKYKIKSLVKVMKALVKIHHKNKESPLIQKGFISRQVQVIQVYKALLSHYYQMAQNQENIKQMTYFQDNVQIDADNFMDTSKKQNQITEIQLKPELSGNTRVPNMRRSTLSLNPIYQSSMKIPLYGDTKEQFQNKILEMVKESRIEDKIDHSDEAYNQEKIESFNDENQGKQFQSFNYETIEPLPQFLNKSLHESINTSQSQYGQSSNT